MVSARESGRKSNQFRLHFGVRCMLVAFVLGLGATQALAQCEEEKKLTASDGALGDQFGQSVSVSGDTAVVGAGWNDCPAGGACGTAYIYRFNGTSWVEVQKLTASDAGLRDLFGTSVSIDGEVAVVGVPDDDCAVGSDCGSAYVFRFDGTSWVEEQKLTASDAGLEDLFGTSVSIDGEVAVVGVPDDDCVAGTNCGAAYIFRFDGASWGEEQKLTASNAKPLDKFGHRVSVSGDTILVGAPLRDCAAGENCGAALVYRFDGTSWVEEQYLTVKDADAGDRFGISVSVSGDTVLVGADGYDCVSVAECGSAYVFRFNGSSWVEEGILTASDERPFSQFGFSVSLNGDTAVVGAPADFCAGGFLPFCGSAYIYRFNGTSWVEGKKLTASDAGLEDLFGISVSVSGETALVGAMWNDCPAGIACGSAYVFDCPKCGNGILDPGEECDGTNDSACPGACQADCTCGPFCGDGTCDPDENSCSCTADCGTPPSNELLDSTCADGLDNDCDGVIDADDPDCAEPTVPTITQWGMILLALLLLATGKIVFRSTANSSGSA